MSDCLLIDKKVLPSYFEKVVLIKERITKGESVSDACKALGLSRSTYYKYKDSVNRPTNNGGKHIILSSVTGADLASCTILPFNSIMLSW